VVLDCNHHLLRNPNPDTYINAILITGTRHRVTVRNCTIEGFGNSIRVAGASSATPGASEIHIEDNLLLGALQTAISVQARAVFIERNRIEKHHGIGIWVSGEHSVTIRENLINYIRSVQDEDAIFLSHTRHARVIGNVVSGLYAAANGNQSTGVLAQGSLGLEASGNIITYAQEGPEPASNGSGYGIWLTYGAGSVDYTPTNLCRDNVVGHFTNPITGCIKAGNTEY
jgi:hypothetical protein